MYYIYVLISDTDNKLYVGFTNDLKSRISRHNNGYVRATKHRRPLQLIHYECYCNLADAKKREKYFKGGKGRAELKIQIREILAKYHYSNK